MSQSPTFLVGQRRRAEDYLAEPLVRGRRVGELGHEGVGLRPGGRHGATRDFQLVLHVQFALLTVAYLRCLYGEPLQIAGVVGEPGAVGAVHGLGADGALNPDPRGGARDGRAFDGYGDGRLPGCGDRRQVDRDQIFGVGFERKVPFRVVPLAVGDENTDAVLGPLVAGPLAPMLGREIEPGYRRVDVHDTPYPIRRRPVVRS